MAGQTVDTQELIDLAEQLRDLGVTEFTIGNIVIKFGGMVKQAAAVPADNEKPAQGRPKSVLEAAEKMWGPVKFGGQT